jgi:hypothetical protein
MVFTFCPPLLPTAPPPPPPSQTTPQILEVLCDDSVALCLSPQAFSNVDPAIDIFNNTNQQFWEYVLPGLDALGYIACEWLGPAWGSAVGGAWWPCGASCFQRRQLQYVADAWSYHMWSGTLAGNTHVPPPPTRRWLMGRLQALAPTSASVPRRWAQWAGSRSTASPRWVPATSASP